MSKTDTGLFSTEVRPTLSLYHYPQQLNIYIISPVHPDWVWGHKTQPWSYPHYTIQDTHRLPIIVQLGTHPYLYIIHTHITTLTTRRSAGISARMT